MKNLIRLIIASSLLFAASSYAQNSPTIGTVTSNIVEKGTGDNYIIVGNVTDGDALAVQNLTVTAISTNNAVLSVTGVMYTQGQSFAIIKVKEFGIEGTATVNFTVMDDDGTNLKPFNINVGFFYTKGCKWSIYDIVFWQNAFPSNSVATKLDSIIPTVKIPTNPAIWDNVGMTITPSNPSAFATTGYKGTLIPSITGVYMFTLDYQDGGEFAISNSNMYNSEYKIGGFRKRTEGAPQVISDTVYLVAGKPYGYQCAYWNVTTLRFELRWAYLGTNPTNVTTTTSRLILPNFNANILDPNSVNLSIPGFKGTSLTADLVNFSVLGTGGLLATYPYYDLMKPLSVSGLTLLRKGSDRMEFKWNASFDSIGVKNYNVYVDGVLRYKTKNDKQTSYLLTGLNTLTSYSVFVTAVDNAGNESNISDIIFDSTFPTDITPPSPPNSLAIDVLADMSAKVSWSPATDFQSGIYGYKVYVDGSPTPYNTDTLNVTSIILKTFDPLSSHTFRVQALNGSLISSTLSTTLGFTTVAYDPLLTSPGVKKLRMNITKDYIGIIDGFGLNTSFGDYSTTYLNNVKKLNSGLIRWGTLGPNTYPYASESVGSRTYAKFINFANRADAAVSISIGVDGTPRIDWRDETIVDVKFGTTTKQMTIMERTAQQMIAYLFAPDEMATKSDPGEEFFPYHADVQKRLNEGFRQATFTGTSSAFKGLIIEFGTEVWGGTSLAAPGSVDHNADGFDDYFTYGLWARKMARAFKSSPYYDSTKVKLSYSMREPQPGNSFRLTESILATNSDPLDVDLGDLLAPGGYLGGNLDYSPLIPAADSELGYYRNSLEYMFKNVNGLYATKNLDNTFRNKQRPFFLYESSMTTPSYNKRVGQAIVLTDYLLTAHKAGSYHTGLFSLEGGEWAMTSENFTVFHPMYKSALLINNVTKGNKSILNTSVTTFEESINDLGTQIKVGNNILDPVSTNIYHKNGVYSIVLISRDFVEDFQVQLSFPSGMLLTPTVTGASKYVFSTTGNFSATTSNVSESSTFIFNNMIVTVPKYSMVVFTFNGEVLPTNNQQLGFSNYRLPSSFAVSYSNLSNPNKTIITEQFGSIEFTATVTGGVVATTFVGWKVTKPNTLESLEFINDANKFRINASDCRSNGVLTITSYLINNPNVNFVFVVTVSGQTNDGSGEPCQAYGGIIPERRTGGVVSINGMTTITSPIRIYGAGYYTATQTVIGMTTIIGSSTVTSSIIIAELTTITSTTITSGNIRVFSPTTMTTNTLIGRPSITTTGNIFVSSIAGTTTVVEVRTSISPQEYFKGFTIHPNPSSGQVTISSEFKGVIKISNSQGLLLSQYEIAADDNDISLSLDSGLYFATFTNSKGSITKKIVITK